MKENILAQLITNIKEGSNASTNGMLAEVAEEQHDVNFDELIELFSAEEESFGFLNVSEEGIGEVTPKTKLSDEVECDYEVEHDYNFSIDKSSLLPNNSENLEEDNPKAFLKENLRPVSAQEKEPLLKFRHNNSEKEDVDLNKEEPLDAVCEEESLVMHYHKTQTSDNCMLLVPSSHSQPTNREALLVTSSTLDKPNSVSENSLPIAPQVSPEVEKNKIPYPTGEEEARPLFLSNVKEQIVEQGSGTDGINAAQTKVEPNEPNGFTMKKQASKVAEQVIMKVTENLNKGNTTFKVQLKPENLGQVDIKIEFSEVSQASQAKVIITAEKFATFEMLNRYSQSLQDNLSNNNGLEKGGLSLEFGLKQDDSQGKNGSSNEGFMFSQRQADEESEESRNLAFEVTEGVYIKV